MMAHPEMIRLLAKQHTDEMIDDADRQRLLDAARRYRRAPLRRHR